MPSPTQYIPQQPFEDENGDLIVTIRVRNADRASKARIISGFPIFVSALPVRGWLGALRIAGLLLSLFA